MDLGDFNETWEESVSVTMNVSADNVANVWNVSLEKYLLLTRGPKHLELYIVLPITVVYAVIFVTGVVGNVAVCAVIVRTAEMHTPTNYYLFSLAVSDLALLLLGLPNDLSVYWQQYPWLLGEILCKIRAVVSEMMSYTSVLTIVAFSIERYLAICHPLYSHSKEGLQRAVRIIAVLWVVSLVSAAPFAAFTTVSYVDYPPGSGQIVDESAFCAMLEENVPAHYPVYELSFLLFFLIPMLVMIVLYVRMGLTIWRPQARVAGSIHRKRKQNHSRKGIVRMLAAVVMAFFLCWAPFHLQRLLYIYGRESPNYREINEWLFYITGCFYYLSSTVNPILYNVMSAKYREAFLKTLFCKESPRAGARDAYSVQDISLGYSNSVYQPRASRKSARRQPLGTTKEVDEEEPQGVCTLIGENTSHVMVVASNGRPKSYITPKDDVSGHLELRDDCEAISAVQPNRTPNETRI
ncbi:neuropeptides capa receptor-like [Anabrus simplex]|uniref:neuropeptides capa receptor-like n=1 Tax=Anabrus simplex TaxID=316456 RepID=UPI0035A3D5B2